VADIRGSEDARRVAELERVKRDLKVSLSLAAPGSPVAVPILAQLSAIDAEPGARTAGGPVRICSSGSAADDPGWLEEPPADHPGHDERGQLLVLPVAPQTPGRGLSAVVEEDPLGIRPPGCWHAWPARRAFTGPPGRPGRRRHTGGPTHARSDATPRPGPRPPSPEPRLSTSSTARYRCSTTDTSTSANPGLPPSRGPQTTSDSEADYRYL
jgi:hypothetical protein